MRNIKKTVCYFARQIFSAFGSGIAASAIVCHFVGNMAEDVTPLFSLGSKGLPLSTMLQLFLLTIVLTFIQEAFMTDRWIKDMSILKRKLCFFFLVMVVILGSVYIWEWFPRDHTKALLAYSITYAVFLGMVTLVTRIKEVTENNNLQEALERFHKKNEELEREKPQ